MRVAVAYENGQVFQHFGHTERFKIYDIENGKIIVATTVNTNGSGHGALADVLKKINVDTLICGGFGEGAKKALSEANITLYGGVSGDADKAIEALLAGTLEFNSEATCDHRSDHRDSSCGNHSNHECSH